MTKLCVPLVQSYQESINVTYTQKYYVFSKFNKGAFKMTSRKEEGGLSFLLNQAKCVTEVGRGSENGQICVTSLLKAILKQLFDHLIIQ